MRTLDRMNFNTPPQAQRFTHERWIAAEAERMKWRREKVAQRRNDRHEGRWIDGATVEATPGPIPSKQGCAEVECERPHKARGLCEMHYKRSRRLQGMTN